MTTVLHYATCPAWTTAQTIDCTCLNAAPWRIVKEPGEQFPWRIWRRTTDDIYEPLMRASSWSAAIQLVDQLIWLRRNAIRRSDSV